MKYLVFLRGVNVGGKALIKMSDLRDSISEAGFSGVSTYIQSGNVIIESHSSNKKLIAGAIAQTIKQHFGLDVRIALFSEKEWKEVIESAPSWWGKDDSFRHNILIVIEPESADQIAKQIGELKPEIENLKAGKGVLYQSILISAISRGSTGSKLIKNASYKDITVRNYNTATKLAKILES